MLSMICCGLLTCSDSVPMTDWLAFSLYAYDKHISMKVIFFHPKSMQSKEKKNYALQVIMCNTAKKERDNNEYLTTENVWRKHLSYKSALKWSTVNRLTWRDSMLNMFVHKHSPALVTSHSNLTTDNDIAKLYTR